MSSIYPPLSYRDVIRILKTLGFSMRPKGSTSHEQWVKTTDGVRRKVTVDKHIEPFDDFLVTSMAKQAGLTKKEFYSYLKN